MVCLEQRCPSSYEFTVAVSEDAHQFLVKIVSGVSGRERYALVVCCPRDINFLPEKMIDGSVTNALSDEPVVIDLYIGNQKPRQCARFQRVGIVLWQRS